MGFHVTGMLPVILNLLQEQMNEIHLFACY